MEDGNNLSGLKFDSGGGGLSLPLFFGSWVFSQQHPLGWPYLSPGCVLTFTIVPANLRTRDHLQWQ